MIDCRESGTIERDPCDLTLHAMNRVENLGKESLIHRKMFENMQIDRRDSDAMQMDASAILNHDTISI